jgi:sigma-B regulation protein RsbU (phosphoserine phosphatase)
MFVTVFLAILDTSTGRVTYGNAGHNPPIFVRQGQGAEFLTGGKSTALGIEEETVFRKAKLLLEPGDTIFLYTDGITEAFNQMKEEFSEERLQRKLSEGPNYSVRETALRILDEVASFSGSMPQSDDITILTIRYNGNSRPRE